MEAMLRSTAQSLRQIAAELPDHLEEAPPLTKEAANRLDSRHVLNLCKFLLGAK